jgi:hypothetical protein
MTTVRIYMQRRCLILWQNVESQRTGWREAEHVVRRLRVHILPRVDNVGHPMMHHGAQLRLADRLRMQKEIGSSSKVQDDQINDDNNDNNNRTHV